MEARTPAPDPNPNSGLDEGDSTVWKHTLGSDIGRSPVGTPSGSQQNGTDQFPLLQKPPPQQMWGAHCLTHGDYFSLQGPLDTPPNAREANSQPTPPLFLALFHPVPFPNARDSDPGHLCAASGQPSSFKVPHPLPITPHPSSLTHSHPTSCPFRLLLILMTLTQGQVQSCY